MLNADTDTRDGERMVTAVIFDMDGTLVDSEHVSKEAWFAAAEQLGVQIPLALYQSFIGRTAASVEDELADYLGGRDRALEAFRVHNEQFDKIARESLDLKPFARESIDALRKVGLKIGLATSTRRRRALLRLERFGLQDAFDAITCGDDGFAHGKPAPDIFLLAADRLGAESVSCAVVEDSFNGVRAGAAAGMHVFMVPDQLEPTAEIVGLCDAVLPSLEGLPAAVASIR